MSEKLWLIDAQDACYFSDFVKVGGRDVVLLMLASPDSSVKWHGADVLAAACQNNPFCQDAFLASNVLPVLTALIDNATESDQVRIKAQYALSCTLLPHGSRSEGTLLLVSPRAALSRAAPIDDVFLQLVICNRAEPVSIMRLMSELQRLTDCVLRVAGESTELEP